MSYANSAASQQQQAMSAKEAAEYRSNANSILGGGRYDQSEQSNTPLIEQEIKNLHEAIYGVEAQVDWLVGKIAPLCQDSNVKTMADNKSPEVVGSQQIQAQPSQLRRELMQMRARLDVISGRIASLKYTIEV